MRRFLVAATAGLLLSACGGTLPAPVFLVESPAGSGTWAPVPSEPAWVAAPPAREGWLRFVGEGASNVRSIATHGGGPSAEGVARRAVEGALLPVVGAEDAGRGAAAAVAGLRRVERACREELVTREMVPGNTLCTAWALWEVPVDGIVAVLPEGKREAAKEALKGIR